MKINQALFLVIPTSGLGGQGTTSTVGAHSDTIGTAPMPQAR